MARQWVQGYIAEGALHDAGKSEWVDRFGKGQRKGADIVVQALERENVNTVFAYPGGASLEIHQALTRSDTVRNILCRHEQVWTPPRACHFGISYVLPESMTLPKS